MLRFDDVAILAHRLAWELEHGPVPDGMLVLHKCCTPACVNVDHLYLGTDAVKVADMYAKGRNRSLMGEDHPGHKITTDAAMIIFGSTRTWDELADTFGVSDSLVYAIKYKKKWKHIHRREPISPAI